MWSDWVSYPGPLTYEPGALPTAPRGRAKMMNKLYLNVFILIRFMKKKYAEQNTHLVSF